MANVPDYMRAVVVEEYGDPSVLKLKENVPVPKSLLPYEVLVKNEASSVNPGECMIREGRIKMVWSLQFPSLIGFDFAGSVVAIGESVTDFSEGDLVFGKLEALNYEKGSYAEYVKVDVKKDSICLRPERLTSLEAASLPTVSTAAYQAVFGTNVGKDDKVVVIGASGGIGTLVVQMAKAQGAYVTGICSSRNVELVKSLGADEVIDYIERDYVKELKDYDYVIDIVGGPDQYSNADLMLKGKTGTFVMICGDYPEKGSIGIGDMAKNMGRLLVRKATRYLTGKPNPVLIIDMGKSSLEPIAELVRENKIKPVIVEEVCDLGKVGEGQRLSESKRARGKIVIKI